MNGATIMGHRGRRAETGPVEGERIRLSVRNFRRELRDRMHLLKARRMAMGQVENLEDLYNAVIEEGLARLEAEVARRES
jgi:hypothetical protein